jgi:hypothetical protein
MRGRTKVSVWEAEIPATLRSSPVRLWKGPPGTLSTARSVPVGHDSPEPCDDRLDSKDGEWRTSVDQAALGHTSRCCHARARIVWEPGSNPLPKALAQPRCRTGLGIGHHGRIPPHVHGVPEALDIEYFGPVSRGPSIVDMTLEGYDHG